MTHHPVLCDYRVVADWRAFDGWELHPLLARARSSVVVADWKGVDTLINLAGDYAGWACRDFHALVAAWNDQLADIGGDPSMFDWHEFRPLRVDREEDWSDWLAFLLGTAKTPEVALSMFARDVNRDTYMTPKVEREVVLDRRRADILIRWRESSVHIEVKIGDRNFDKTIDTAKAIEQRFTGSAWRHYLLVPAEDEVDAAKSLGENTQVRVLTWDHVAVALRRALANARAEVRWRVFAHALCGTIEQRLLKCQRADEPTRCFTDLVSRQRLIRIMERASRHERPR